MVDQRHRNRELCILQKRQHCHFICEKLELGTRRLGVDPQIYLIGIQGFSPGSLTGYIKADHYITGCHVRGADRIFQIRNRSALAPRQLFTAEYTQPIGIVLIMLRHLIEGKFIDIHTAGILQYRLKQDGISFFKP